MIPVVITTTGPKHTRSARTKELIKMYQGSRHVVRHYVNELPSPLPQDATIIVVEKKGSNE